MKSSSRNHNHVEDEGGDRKYFVQIPVFIWAMVRDPYDLVLWHTIKMIAWEKGVCKLSTEDLAVLSMMSVGKVSECRQRLIDLGLINGSVKKEADYPQPVWHLTIPDVWEENVAWAKEHDTKDKKITHNISYYFLFYVLLCSKNPFMCICWIVFCKKKL